MKYAKKQWKRKCLCMPCDEFEELINTIFDEDIAIEYCCEDNGWYVEDNDDDISEYDVQFELEKYFGIKITDIHADDCQPCRLWISYKEVRE